MNTKFENASGVGRKLVVLLVLMSVVCSLLPACQAPGATAEKGDSMDVEAAGVTSVPAVPATSTPAPPIPQPWPPRIVQTVPAAGEEQPLEAPITILFDQPMDRGAVEAAFSIDPKVDGTFEWPQPDLLEFTPAADLERGQQYTISLASGAAGESGEKLLEPVTIEFQTVGYLEVASVQPVADTEEVSSEATVTVLFNRPVVPLVAIEDQGTLPQPLVFVPPVRGRGEWLNTSIYQFVPDEGFEPATTYKARISSGLEDSLGGVLAEDFTWEFTTVMPAVVATNPSSDGQYVSIEPTIEVAFNQPMNHESVEAKFSLVESETNDLVEGTFQWVTGGVQQPTTDEYGAYDYYWDEGAGPQEVGVETMMFTPRKPLRFGVPYLALVPADTQGAKGKVGTRQDYSWSFTTIEYPEITSTYPADGEEAADPWGGIEVSFSSPMNPDSVNGNFTIRPVISPTEVFTYWWSSNTQLQLSFDTKASSDYQVTFSRDIEGRDGQRLGKDTTVRWTTRALGPQVFVYQAGSINTHLAYTPTVAFFNVRNVSQVQFALYRMPFSDFVQAAGDASWEFWDNYHGSKKDLVRRWSENVAPELNESLIYSTNLSGKKGGKLDPGIYYLEMSVSEEAVYPQALGSGFLPSQQLALIVSNNNVTFKTTQTDSFVWATDLRTGDVAASLPIRVFNQKGAVLAEGTTDKDGVFVGDRHEAYDPWTAVFAVVGDPDDPDQDFAVASSLWTDGISPWEFNVSSETYLQSVNAHFLTDRTIYRPGQTVYFKGIFRGDDDANYSLPSSDKDVQVKIYDGFGNTVYDESLSINDMGTVNGELELGEETGLGYYSIEATYDDAFFYAGFQVAEYRKPEYQVAVETDKDEYVDGDEVQVSAVATYYFGGAVADAQVRYSVLSADRAFDYQGKGWWDFTDYDYSREMEYYGSYGELLAEGTGATDADGRFTFSVNADIAKYVSSQLLTIEVTVTDVNNQQVSSRVEAVVHKGTYYIGVRPEEYVGQAGEENGIQVLTVDWDSQPSLKRKVQIVVNEHNWYSVRKQAEDGQFYWESEVEDIPVYTTTVTTDQDGLGDVKFSPDEGGVFKIVASGLDEKRREVRSLTYMWVSGRKFINWRQENNDRIDLVANQRDYQVGDTATVLIPHPYQGEVQALITVERGHIYQHWVQTLETNSDQIEIPITEDLVPNVFVSVVIVKGQDETNPLPSFKIGYATLPIDVAEKELQVSIKPDKPAGEHYQPRDSVTYSIEVTDNHGAPVEAELALSLVDLSVLSLADEPQKMVDTFWRQRGLAVSTASGLTLSADRVNMAVAPEAKGGGGGMGDEFGVVRREFPDTAYWNAVVTTDAKGKASVTVKLPDNLTTWRLSAWAVSADTLVGEARVDIVSTKNLLVRPVAPRFFVVGDKVELSTVVNNNTNEALDVEVAFDAEGVTVEGDARQQVDVPANGKTRIAWMVTVDDGEEVTLRFGAKAGDLTDAMETKLPVYRSSTPEVVATAGVLEDDGEQTETVVLPGSYDATQGELTVRIDPSLAAGMIEGLDYLEHYPYECTEQTVSRFLPNVVTYRAFKELGLENLPGASDEDADTKLAGLVGVGLQRLYNQQHYDGGWGWWMIDESDPFLTAYVLLGVVEARDAGFVVEDDVVQRAVEFVEGSLLRQPKAIDEPWLANRQAFLLYVLAEAGSGDLGRSVSLFERRDILDTFGKAYLAMALGLLEAEEPSRVNALLSDFSSSAIVSATGAHWEESQVDYYAMNTDTRSTAIVLGALARLDPKNALAPNAVRWLMTAREDGIWETTQENAWAIIALTDWMVATHELEAAYDWQILVNGEDLGSGSVSAANVDESTQLQLEVAKLLADQANHVRFERTAPSGKAEGAGRLYYGMYLRYFKPVAEVKALDRGIIVSRQYSLAGCDEEKDSCSAIDQADVGDVIQVKLTIIAPNDLHHVVVEDPFPAGAEGVDQSLKTTSVVGQAPELTRTDRRDPWGGGYGWWWFSHTEMRDEKAVLFATYLPRGTYEYTYLIRASVTGEYRVIPTHAYEMYFPEVFGRGDGGVFTVTE